MGREGGGMITIRKVEGRGVDGSVMGIVVCEFSKGKEGCPIGLLIVSEGAEVGFKGLDGAF
jgi:hypothetical protein